ncbi:DUF6371 domain-containing protein [Maribacter aurantiacus]|uniref:Toprim domain-containing protein n=1 Tax=Maribacter aurantiacus TaxID=1882343 RepID=A0A5R8MC63_9FLAO|nr:DUF6371 domain-containing protein [Maribacter aurantiacus]TLF47116.1 hypothetical protein FEK29_04950 [Maribacter aurantiacus]
MYTYSLDKSSKKFHCPKCTEKTFVRFMDNERGTYLDGDFGRCDRESKCGYFNMPKSTKGHYEKPAIYLPPKPSVLDESVIPKYGNNYESNHFITFLLSKFNEEDVIRAIEQYYIGTHNLWPGSAVFWQIDHNLKIRTGKVMLYDCNTGKRVKKPFPHINWMHKVLQIKNFVLQQCLFGLHLIPESNNTPVCIVESEKTAVIMSIVLPQYIWMATGAKTNLKEDLLSPLKNSRIILYPDNSEYKDWNTKATILTDRGFKVSCSNLIENYDMDEGDDLADLLLSLHI